LEKHPGNIVPSAIFIWDIDAALQNEPQFAFFQNHPLDSGILIMKGKKHVCVAKTQLV
jgi:hypothetical protein